MSAETLTSTRTTVATFNIRHCRGLDERVDVARTAEVVTGLDADVIALQEIDRFHERSGDVDQVAELARLTGYELSFHPTVIRGRSEYGIALAARRALDATLLPLPRAGREEARGAVVAAVGGVTYIGTHLSPLPQAHPLQVAALAELVGATSGPVVLMGDLNATRRWLRPLFAAGLAPPGWGPLTAPSRTPWRQIDHVLAGGGAWVERRRAVRTAASDHLPVVATLAVA